MRRVWIAAVAVTLVMVTEAGANGVDLASLCQGCSIWQQYHSPDGTAGGVVAIVNELLADDGADRRAGGTKAVGASCHFKVDAVITGNPNDVVLTVYGSAGSNLDSSGAPTLSVRPVATEIQCLVFNEAGTKVFDLTRAESGAVVPIASQTTIRNDGPYTICLRADGKYENGPDMQITMICNLP